MESAGHATAPIEQLKGSLGDNMVAAGNPEDVLHVEEVAPEWTEEEERKLLRK